MINRKSHWKNIYETKPFEQTSWFLEKPIYSIAFFEALKLPKTAKIIDVGGGESYLVDYLLEAGYEDVTVLDISEIAIEKVKKRLGAAAEKVKWIVDDIATFVPSENYDCWHDRAAFHFLTAKEHIQHYLNNLKNNIAENGVLLLATFSKNGPLKCSGIPITQYSESDMEHALENDFTKIECNNHQHRTPSDKIQDFTFCSFRKK